jgi:hypothetical protein
MPYSGMPKERERKRGQRCVSFLRTRRIITCRGERSRIPGNAHAFASGIPAPGLIRRRDHADPRNSFTDDVSLPRGEVRAEPPALEERETQASCSSHDRGDRRHTRQPRNSGTIQPRAPGFAAESADAAHVTSDVRPPSRRGEPSQRAEPRKGPSCRCAFTIAIASIRSLHRDAPRQATGPPRTTLSFLSLCDRGGAVRSFRQNAAHRRSATTVAPAFRAWQWDSQILRHFLCPIPRTVTCRIISRQNFPQNGLATRPRSSAPADERRRCRNFACAMSRHPAVRQRRPRRDSNP